MKKNTVKKSSINAPFFQEKINVLLICLSRGFTGANFIISCIFENNLYDKYCKTFIYTGIIMLCMVPLAYFDERKEMRGKFIVIMSCIMHFVLSLLIAYALKSLRIIAFYVIEVVIIISIVYIKHTRYQKNNQK